MSDVTEKGIGKALGLDLDHFLVNLMDWNGISPIFVGLDICYLVPSL